MCLRNYSGKLIFWTVLLFCSRPVTAAQAADAQKIRCLKQEEVMRITDGTGDVIFNRIRHIRCDEKGRVYVKGKNGLYVFDAQGNYGTNLLKFGQGPGETTYFGGFSCGNNKVVVCNMGPLKIMCVDPGGKLLDEIKVDTRKPFTPYAFTFRGWHYLIENNLKHEDSRDNICPWIHSLVKVDNSGRVFRTGLDFSTRYALIRKKSKTGNPYVSMLEISRFNFVFDGSRYLYVSHKCRYEIARVDMETMQVVRRFKCHFLPEKFKAEDTGAPDQKKLESIAGRKYFNDIQALRCVGKDLLVFTASIDTQKGVRVDRFNSEGMRTDSFFLSIPGILRPHDLEKKPMHVQPGFFWTTMRDEEENPVVVKYRVNW